MTSAHIYFAAVSFLMASLAVVYMLCRDVVKKRPHVMPDQKQRDRYRWSELAMAFTCLAMVWYMWMILDFMVTFCATQPTLGAITHVPWIVGMAGVLGTKTGHLMRLRVQALL